MAEASIRDVISISIVAGLMVSTSTMGGSDTRSAVKIRPVRTFSKGIPAVACASAEASATTKDPGEAAGATPFSEMEACSGSLSLEATEIPASSTALAVPQAYDCRTRPPATNNVFSRRESFRLKGAAGNGKDFGIIPRL